MVVMAVVFSSNGGSDGSNVIIFSDEGGSIQW